MLIQLIEGNFNTKDAIEIITELFHVKIKYHENKISASLSEEDIKFRESKIKALQNELHEFRKQINLQIQDLKIESTIKIGEY